VLEGEDVREDDYITGEMEGARRGCYKAVIGGICNTLLVY